MSKEDVELTRQSLEKDLLNAKKEIEAISGALKEILERKALLEEQMDLRKKMHDVAMRPGGFENLRPTWAFQRDEEYTDLQRKLSDNEFKVKSVELEQVLERIKENIQTYKEQIESQTKHVEDNERRLAELGE